MGLAHVYSGREGPEEREPNTWSRETTWGEKGVFRNAFCPAPGLGWPLLCQPRSFLKMIPHRCSHFHATGKASSVPTHGVKRKRRPKLLSCRLLRPSDGLCVSAAPTTF